MIHEDAGHDLYDIPCREGYSQHLHSALKVFRNFVNDKTNRRTGDVNTVAIGNPVVAEPHQHAPTTNGQRCIRPHNLGKHVSDCSLWISPFNSRYLCTTVTPCWESIQSYLGQEGVLQPQRKIHKCFDSCQNLHYYEALRQLVAILKYNDDVSNSRRVVNDDASGGTLFR